MTLTKPKWPCWAHQGTRTGSRCVGVCVLRSVGVPGLNFTINPSIREFIIIMCIRELELRNFGMCSSRMTYNEIILKLYQDTRTVFKIADIALLTGQVRLS